MVIGIVDSDEQALENLSGLITTEHPEIKIAFCSSSGAGALDKMKNVYVDVLITDMNLPDMDGFELCRKIYDEKYNTETIVLSGHVDYENQKKSLKYGVSKCILKPLTKESIAGIMEHIRHTDEIKKGEMELRRRVGSVEFTNSVFKMLKDGDEAFIHKIVFPAEIRYKKGGAIKGYEIFLINILCFFLNENGYEDVFEEDIFAEMFDLFTDEQRMNYVMEKYSYVIEMLRNREANSPDNKRIIKVKRYIDEHYDNTELSCDFLAERSDMSSRHLRRLFVKTYGSGVQEYIMNIRIETAKKLLRETILPIDTIISKVGYSSPRYFRKLFKAQLGCTMSEYRIGKTEGVAEK